MVEYNPNITPIWYSSFHFIFHYPNINPHIYNPYYAIDASARHVGMVRFYRILCDGGVAVQYAVSHRTGLSFGSKTAFTTSVISHHTPSVPSISAKVFGLYKS